MASEAKAAAQRASPRSRPIGGAGDVGPRLRKRREERALSLRELARRLNISPSALSQIETGKSRPSVSTLYAVVNELGMSLDELFAGKPSRRRAQSGPTASRAASPAPVELAAPDDDRVQRHATRSAIVLESGVRWERLTAKPDAEADFLYVVYDIGGSSSSSDQFIRHAGREYGLVLSGTLEVTVGFDTYNLGPGDSISFDSTTPHRLRNKGSQPVHAVWFVAGRRADARAHGFAEPAPSGE
jgi:transcriptional regulator with XRE-family HTH domain